jgi:small-conductance mechanosensitive channel
MRLALAILASVAVSAILVAVVSNLRRFLLIRQLSFVLFVAAIAAGIKTFTLINPGEYATFDHALSWILMFLIAITVIRIAGLLYFDLHLPHRGVRLPTLLPVVTVGLAYLVAGLITFKISFPEQPMSGLFGAGALTTLVLGLALQPILGNIFAGIVIGLEKPYRINDWIKVGDVEGRVVSISLRTTHLRTRDSDNLIVPNSRMADDRILNYYYPHPMHLERVLVHVPFTVRPYRVKRTLLAAATGVPGVLEKPTPDVYIRNFDDRAIIYELRVWIEDIGQQPRIHSDVRFKIWDEFHRARIPFAYPVRRIEQMESSKPIPVEPGRPPRARLFVAVGDEAGQQLELGSRRILVGRGKGCDLALADGQASKEHIAIEWQDEGFVMTDLETSNGTRLNGEKATRAVLRDLDRIFIGDTVLVFEADGV